MSETGDPRAISHPSQPVSSLLGTIPSLRFATPARLRELADVTQRERVDVGETIIKQGEYSDDVFLIIDGTFDVLISHFGHTPDFIRELRAGDSFGELGVLYDVPRTATVRCTELGPRSADPRRDISRRARYWELIAATMGGWTKQRCAN